MVDKVNEMDLIPHDAQGFHAWLKKAGGCEGCRTWSRGKTLQEAWEQCPRSDWVLWLLEEAAYAWPVGIEAKWLDEREPIDAKWLAARASNDAKWLAERTAIYAKWLAERTAIEDKRQVELAAIEDKWQVELAAIDEKWRAQFAVIEDEWQAELAAILRSLIGFPFNNYDEEAVQRN
jgi:hypothetical protein